MSHDPQGLERFVQAQAPVYEAVRAELRAGRKSSHWMWFIFPQLRGLGRSAMAIRFGIASAQEAALYLQHPLLGARLADCTRLMGGVAARSALDILGSPDDLKFCSCMTLFAQVAPDPALFQRALARFCGGRSDPRTLALLGIGPAPGPARG